MRTGCLRGMIVPPGAQIGRVLSALQLAWRPDAFSIVSFCFGFCCKSGLVAEAGGTDAHEAAKDRCEMLLIFKARSQRHFEDRSFRISQHLFALLNAEAQHEFVRAHIHGGAELM